MKARLAIRAAVQVLTAIALFFGALLGYGYVASSRAEAKAKNACARMPVGISAASALSTAQGFEANPRLRFIAAEDISVGFEGAFLIEKWFCNVHLSAGRVTSNEVRCWTNMRLNKSIDTDPQQQKAASPRVLVVRSFSRRRHVQASRDH
jgi:hypothetical protein